MRGLRKYLTPFAPDQSGAVSVLYELGGLLVICDAGGCTGNVCGFDEPRWFGKRSAVFSAGLRDMDAILGRDDKLVEKLVQASEKLEASFAAVIGTPVPAVIATDYHAMKRMLQKKTGLPILTIDSDGTKLYDSGEEKAWLSLFQNFAKEQFTKEEELVGVLGMTPQDISDLRAPEKLCSYFKNQEKKKAVCYGMGAGLEEIQKASAVSWNLVVSPAALKTAQYLKEKFGTPYEIDDPIAADLLPEMDYENKNILVVQQQVIAHALRKELRKRGAKDVCCAGWFMQKQEIAEPGDVSLKEEDDYINLVNKGNFDVIIADGCMERMTPEFSGKFIDIPHFAVSGRLCQ